MSTSARTDHKINNHKALGGSNKSERVGKSVGTRIASKIGNDKALGSPNNLARVGTPTSPGTASKINVDKALCGEVSHQSPWEPSNESRSGHNDCAGSVEGDSMGTEQSTVVHTSHRSQSQSCRVPKGHISNPKTLSGKSNHCFSSFHVQMSKHVGFVVHCHENCSSQSHENAGDKTFGGEVRQQSAWEPTAEVVPTTELAVPKVTQSTLKQQ